MGSKSYRIIRSNQSKKDFEQIVNYIAEMASPSVANTYLQRMLLHINTLTHFPDRNLACRYFRFNKKQYLCTVFEGTYIIAYVIKNQTVVIKRVVHGKRLG